MANERIELLARTLAALFVCALSLVLFSPRAYGASIGVTVDQPTTTTAPPTTTTVPPTTTTVPPTTTTAPTTTTTAPATTTTLEPETTLPPVVDTLPEVMPDPVPVVTKPKESGFVGNVKSAAKTTQNLVAGVASGKPLADVAQAVLPENVANVVVPAIRTTSTFVFPIGLAAAVVAFLALQQRIDAGDPKLNAAPMAHNDDVVKFS